MNVLARIASVTNYELETQLKLDEIDLDLLNHSKMPKKGEPKTILQCTELAVFRNCYFKKKKPHKVAIIFILAFFSF